MARNVPFAIPATHLVDAPEERDVAVLGSLRRDRKAASAEAAQDRTGRRELQAEVGRHRVRRCMESVSDRGQTNGGCRQLVSVDALDNVTPLVIHRRRIHRTENTSCD